MKNYILFLAVALFIGCRAHRQRTVDQFAFLKHGMPINVVTNRVGQPDHGYHGQYRLRYDLADGTEMVVTARYQEEYALDYLRVYWFGQWRDTNWLWLKESDK